MSPRPCDHQPRPESCRTLAGAPASVLNRQDYPITAACLNCGAPIRSETFLITDGRPWVIARLV